MVMSSEAQASQNVMELADPQNLRQLVEKYYDETWRDFMHHLNFHFYGKKPCILNQMSFDCFEVIRCTAVLPHVL